MEALKSPLLNRIQEPGELSRVIDVCLSASSVEDVSSRDLCITMARQLSYVASPRIDVDSRIRQLCEARSPFHQALPRSLASEFTTNARTPINHRSASERRHTKVSSSVLVNTATSALDMCSSLPHNREESHGQQSSNNNILSIDWERIYSLRNGVTG